MPYIYRIVPLGPTGCGKSQLCNFIYKDKSNTKFKVSEGFDSQTKDPQSEIFIRKIDDEAIELELIDTAGCSDSDGNDEENFKKLVDKLKEKKAIDLFILVFKFTQDRIDKQTKDYIKLIANTFTPTEFYNHLAIIFTQYPQNPDDDDKRRKEMKTSEIIRIIKNIIGLGNGQSTIPPNIYELDTKKYNDNFIPKFQATIDIILLKMKDVINIIGPVNSENIKYCGVEDRLKEEQKKLEQKKLEFERLKKMEEERRQISEELMKKREQKIKEDDEQNKRERERLQELDQYLSYRSAEISKKEDEHKKIMEQLNNIISKNNVEINHLNNLIENNINIINDRKTKIDEENKKKRDGIIDMCCGFSLKFIDWGDKKYKAGKDKYHEAKKQIKKYESEINEKEEENKDYQKKKENCQEENKEKEKQKKEIENVIKNSKKNENNEDNNDEF